MDTYHLILKQKIKMIMNWKNNIRKEADHLNQPLIFEY